MDAGRLRRTDGDEIDDALLPATPSAQSGRGRCYSFPSSLRNSLAINSVKTLEFNCLQCLYSVTLFKKGVISSKKVLQFWLKDASLYLVTRLKSVTYRKECHNGSSRKIKCPPRHKVCRERVRRCECAMRELTVGERRLTVRRGRSP